MNDAPSGSPGRLSPIQFGRGRPLAVALALVLGLLLAESETRFETVLRNAIFDAYQVLMPRERLSDSVIVVAIDDESLRQIGQWPWPRTRIASLIDRISDQRPAQIGLDFLFAEPDRFSPQRMIAEIPFAPDVAALGAIQWPDFDSVLGASLKRAGATLAVAGLLEPDEDWEGESMVPLVLQSEPDARLEQQLWNFPSTLGSISTIDDPMLGHGLVNAIPRDSLLSPSGRMPRHDEVIRRVPAISIARDNLMPAFSVEVLRRALGAPLIRVNLDHGEIRTLEFSDRKLPLSPDGSWWIHFSAPEERVIVPAHALIGDDVQAQFDPGILTGRIVLLGPVASGLNDLVETPVGIVPGVSVHAEAIDNVLDGRLLSRPGWTQLLELALFALVSAAFVVVVPMLGVRMVGLFALALIVALALLGANLFSQLGLLVDVLSPTVAGLLVASVVIASSLVRAEQSRARMRTELRRTREERARIEGTLDAARRIQMGMLPDASKLSRDDSRFALAANMISASSVGGDLYDFFKIGEDRLFFVLGDVSGKGVPASLFMALSKALIKGAAQNLSSDPGKCLSGASALISQENPESMFVSGVACLLDLNTGQLCWCSAGHDNPIVVEKSSGKASQLASEGGPALCVLDTFEYPTERHQLAQDDLVCLISDGVTEAENAAGEQYGLQRLTDCLKRSDQQGCPDVVESVRRDAAAFVGDREFGDDFTVVVMRWNGSAVDIPQLPEFNGR